MSILYGGRILLFLTSPIAVNTASATAQSVEVDKDFQSRRQSRAMYARTPGARPEYTIVMASAVVGFGGYSIIFIYHIMAAKKLYRNKNERKKKKKLN